MSASRLALALCLALAVSACGKKSPIEYPVSLDQVTPWNEEGRKAIDPPRDANGKVIEPESSRQAVPPLRSLPIDVILN
ncbi:MAG: hypothetical protein K2X10_09795 [Hyphomicrobiales bacterium]|nr:hypothetical protein [Hyphomicrobiales bacterium]OQW81233.1 MAG: hypothetical protein BVN31_11310 [Proteobacteria bacterium ST_bin15]